MREFTKSMFSFSWAMSLFGAQQMLNFLSPSKAVNAFDEVTSATRNELGQPLQTAFEAGDQLQRRMIDLMFGDVGGALGGRPRDGSAAQAPNAQYGRGASGGHQGAAGPGHGSAYAPPSHTSGAGWGAVPVSAPPSESARGGAASEGQIPHETGISPDYPFRPNYVSVFGSKMHYVDEGSGQPIILLHGNPTWSYLWRNVIPHLSPYGRCIAPDLIGYGRSDKPSIEYRWSEQARYLNEFIRKLGLRNVTLVLHDWGVSLGLNYAMHNEGNVRGIAFFEGIFKTFPNWEDFSTPGFRELFRKFREGGEGGEGWEMLVNQNFFIEQLLSAGVGRRLTETEMNYYREPFRQTRSRVPIWQLSRSVPVAGEPEEVWASVSQITEWLKRSELPKLLFHATPGGLITSDTVDWCRRNLNRLQTVPVGPGLHYLQESSPRLIGTELAEWFSRLGAGR